jgi:predicted ester cyclase
VTDPTGEAKNGVLRLDFDRRIMVQFRGSVVFRQAIFGRLTGYEDVNDALRLIVDGDNAVIRWSMPCTHLGVFRGIEPTGQPVRSTGMDILRIENGKITARWDEGNDRVSPPYV